MNDNIPVQIYDYRKSYLFGLIKVRITITDQKTKYTDRRYKHMISFQIFRNKISCVLRSSSQGIYTVDGKEVSYITFTEE